MRKKTFPCSSYLNGEFGVNDICIGVPVVLGKNGIEEIVEINLDQSDMDHLKESAEGVRKTNKLLNI